MAVQGKLRVFVDDVTAPLVGRNLDLVEKAGKVMRKLKEEMEEKGLKLSIMENGKEGKSEMIASCGCCERKLWECGKEEGVTMADRVETLGVDLRTKIERFEVQGEVLATWKEQSLSDKLHVDRVRKLLRTGLGPSRASGAQARGKAPTERLNLRRQMAAATCEESASFSLFLEVHDLEVEKELSTMATQAWAEGVCVDWKWPTEQSRFLRFTSGSERTCRSCYA